jgi:SAM-dependent methyltransferase
VATTSPTAHSAERVLRPGEQELYDAWRDLVEANAAQIERLWEPPPTDDRWGPGYGLVTLSPEDVSPHAQAVTPLAHEDDTWLDIGAGFGSTGLPLARLVRHITAVDPSPGMTELLKANVERLGIDNVEVLPPAMCPPAAQLDRHDVCLAALTLSDVPDIGEFLDSMEWHATRLCVVLLAELGCGFTPPEPIFELLHGEAYIRPPALREFLAVMGARRRRFEISTYQILRGPEDVDAGIPGCGGGRF